MPDARSLMAAGLGGPFCPATPLQVLPSAPLPPHPGPGLGCAGGSRGWGACLPGHLGPGAALSSRVLLNKNLPPPHPLPTPTSSPIAVMSVSGVEYKFPALERDAQPGREPRPPPPSCLRAPGRPSRAVGPLDGSPSPSCSPGTSRPGTRMGNLQRSPKAGSIVPGAGAVPGAGGADPGAGTGRREPAPGGPGVGGQDRKWGEEDGTEQLGGGWGGGGGR